MKDIKFNVPLMGGAGAHRAQVARIARESMNRIVD